MREIPSWNTIRNYLETEYNKDNGEIVKTNKLIYIDYLILKRYLDKKAKNSKDTSEIRNLYKDA